ncbi:MAG: cysteine-rich small domain-containing protein [Tissierellia bacterium]|nr:cysteine-rich small domain-containing protein [Tissierellia bacterium]
MEHYKYFTNEQCEYFPCHQTRGTFFNCLFCYCPLYFLEEKCGGKFVYKNGVKVCTHCTIPHTEGGYDYIIGVIKKVNDEKRGANEPK